MSSVYVTSVIPNQAPRIFASDFVLSPSSIKRVEEWERGDRSLSPSLVRISEPDLLYCADMGCFGVLTVLDRMTGFGWRDVESGFRAFPYRGVNANDFWLASGQFDIRQHIPAEGIDVLELISIIKRNANSVVGE